MSRLSSRTLVTRNSKRQQGGRAAVAATADPILPKIEKSKHAWATFDAVCRREPIPLYTPEHDAWEEQQQETYDAWSEAFEEMVATQPTSRLGAVALIDCFLESERDNLDRVNGGLVLVNRLRTFLQGG